MTSRATPIDHHVGARMRERRILLGLTQTELADLLNITYQQAHKYEKGINRVSASRLYSIARALNVPVAYFFHGLSDAHYYLPPPTNQRLLLELSRTISSLPRHHQETVASLVRALAKGPSSSEPTEQRHAKPHAPEVKDWQF